jgi:hypothetical protein
MDPERRRAIALFRFGVLVALVSARLEHGDRKALFAQAAKRDYVTPWCPETGPGVNRGAFAMAAPSGAVATGDYRARPALRGSPARPAGSGRAPRAGPALRQDAFVERILAGSLGRDRSGRLLQR